MPPYRTARRAPINLLQFDLTPRQRGWQRVHLGGRLAILDASHNPEGAQVLDRNLDQLEAETGRAPVVITAALGAARAVSTRP